MPSTRHLKYWVLGAALLMLALMVPLAVHYGVPYLKARRWRELTVRAEELYNQRFHRQGSSAEGIRAAEEALQIAEQYFPYGHESCEVTLEAVVFGGDNDSPAALRAW